VSVYVGVYEERERISVTLVTTAAQGCANNTDKYTILSKLPVHTVTQKQHTYTQPTLKTQAKHTYTQPTLKTQANACQVMIENQHVQSSTVSQYSATRNTHTHPSDESPAKTSGGRADNWLLIKSSTLYRGETGGERANQS
jgi:hypothetical protein